MDATVPSEDNLIKTLLLLFIDGTDWTIFSAKNVEALHMVERGVGDEVALSLNEDNHTLVRLSRVERLPFTTNKELTHWFTADIVTVPDGDGPNANIQFIRHMDTAEKIIGCFGPKGIRFGACPNFLL